MNKIILFILTGLFLLNLSCKKDSAEEFNPVNEPDKVIANAPGRLQYYKEFNLWGVKYDFPLQTYDAEDHYLIRTFECKEISLAEGMKVLLSGRCYRRPQAGVIAGIEYYDVIATGLEKDEFNPAGAPEKILDNFSGTVSEYPEIHLGGIEYNSADGKKEIYLIKKFECDEATLVYGQNIQLSGKCYNAQMPFNVPEGTKYYYTIATKIVAE
jgi:hypothetical protein